MEKNNMDKNLLHDVSDVYMCKRLQTNTKLVYRYANYKYFRSTFHRFHFDSKKYFCLLEVERGALTVIAYLLKVVGFFPQGMLTRCNCTISSNHGAAKIVCSTVLVE